MKTSLEESIRSGKVSHAYLFGRLSEEFAKALLCTGEGSLPCGKCHSCKQIEAGSNPDYIIVENGSEASIGVDKIRQKISDTVKIRPFGGDRKIYIIKKADLMTFQAQNALLKTLEEPPQYVTVILETEKEKALLETILSRCIKIGSGDFEENESEEEIKRYAEIIENAVSKDIADLYEETQKIKADEGAALAAFSRKLFRDILKVKLSGNSENICFTEYKELIKELAKRYEKKDISSVIEAIDTAEERLKANTNPQITVRMMLMSMRKER